METKTIAANQITSEHKIRQFMERSKGEHASELVGFIREWYLLGLKQVAKNGLVTETHIDALHFIDKFEQSILDADAPYRHLENVYTPEDMKAYVDVLIRTNLIGLSVADSCLRKEDCESVTLLYNLSRTL